MHLKQISKILFSSCILFSVPFAAPAKIRKAQQKNDTERIVNTSPNNPWPKQKTPKSGAFNVIGFYTGGCFTGGVALEVSGKHHEVMRPSRNRFYGHPQLMDMIRQIGAISGNKILIGDMAQPRGGPAPFGHASHQLGLEADIWYQPLSFFTSAAMTKEQRESFEMTSVVSDDWRSFRPERWASSMDQVIMAAAANPKVDRIFVNAVVKRHFCEKYPQFAHLNKLRPWYFHNAHFHVRMKCPEGMSQCRNQAPIPTSSGCDEVGWWLRSGVIATQINATEDPVSRVVKMPLACRAVAE